MSKSYIYFAKKRNSHRYYEVTPGCTYKQSNKYIRCKTCLKYTGTTREKQKFRLL